MVDASHIHVPCAFMFAAMLQVAHIIQQGQWWYWLLLQARTQYAAETKALKHVVELLEGASMGMSRTRERVSYIVSMLDATIAALKSEAKAVRCACTALWHSALSSRFPCIATWLRAAGMFLSTHLYLHMPAH